LCPAHHIRSVNTFNAPGGELVRQVRGVFAKLGVAKPILNQAEDKSPAKSFAPFQTRSPKIKRLLSRLQKISQRRQKSKSRAARAPGSLCKR
jgi:hypothetical protein